MSSSILLTGVAGFIGTHVAESLLQQGYEVYGVDNLLPNYPLPLKQAHITQLQQYPGFHFFTGDILAPQLWPRLPLLQGVVHAASRVGVRDSLTEADPYWQTNSWGTLRLLEWCRQQNIIEFILLSSSSVYGNHPARPWSESLTDLIPLSPYAASKRSAEMLLQTYSQLYGMRTAILRLFTVYGPQMRPDLAVYRFTQAMLTHQPLTLWGDGTSQRDYTYIADVTQGIGQALAWLPRQAKGTCGIFNLGAQQPVALFELVQHLAGLLEMTPQVLFKAAHPAETSHTWANIAKAREVLGYEPQTGLAEGLARFVEWYQTA